MPPTVKLRVHTLDVESTPANDAMHCPIATQLRDSDDDISHPYVTREVISFSRKSTGKRYTYYAPRPAKRFVDETDDPHGDPRPFLLTLTDEYLIEELPVRKNQVQPRKAAGRKPLIPSRDNGNRRYRGSIRVSDTETRSTTLARKATHKRASTTAPTAREPKLTSRQSAVKASRAPVRRRSR